MAEGFDDNVEFFELIYLDPEDVELVDCAINSMSNSGALSARALLCG